MGRLLRHRQPAQAMVGLIGLMMLTLIGTVAIVADWGVFFVLYRELQTAADAGALAAAWYEPVCDPVLQSTYGCQPASSGPTPKGPCLSANRPQNNIHHDEVACEVALEVTAANLGSVVGLCDGFDPMQSIQPYVTTPGAVTGGNVQRYVVMINCRARHLMGTVLPNVGPTLDSFPPVFATATIGYRGPNGDVVASPPAQLITRLVPTH